MVSNSWFFQEVLGDDIHEIAVVCAGNSTISAHLLDSIVVEGGARDNVVVTPTDSCGVSSERLSAKNKDRTMAWKEHSSKPYDRPAAVPCR